MTITTAQAVSLLENTLFESSTLATANAPALAAAHNATDTPLSLANTLAASAEAGIASQVIRYYQAALGRTPGAVEIQYYVAIAEQGLSAAQIAQGAGAVSQAQWNIISSDFVSSPEFQKDFSAGGSDLVKLFYENILGRAPSSTESAYYQNQLGTGFTNATLMQEFSNSPEYQNDSNATITLALAGTGAVAAAGGHAGAVYPNATFNVTASVKSLTEGGSVAFTITTTGLPTNITLAYSVDGVSASSLSVGNGYGKASGLFTPFNGTYTIDMQLSDLPNQDLSGNLNFYVTVPGYTGNLLVSASVALTETSTVTLTADPAKTIAGATGSTNELIVDYANPTASAFTGNVSGFQVLGLGGASSGTYDLAGLGLSGAAIDLTANLAAGSVTVTNASASQVLSIHSSITSENELTVQMSSQAAASANPTLTVNLTPGVQANISHLTDTVTVGGTLAVGDVISWTVDSQTLHYTIVQGDTPATVAAALAHYMYGQLDAYAPVYTLSASGNTVSVSGGFWQNSMKDQISATGGETFTIAHTQTTTYVHTPGYTTLNLNTGDSQYSSSYLQIDDPALTHLVLTGSAEILFSAQTAQLSYVDASHYTALGVGLQAQYAASGVTVIAGNSGFEFDDSNLNSGATATFTGGNGNNTIDVGNYTNFKNTANAVITVGNGYNYINVGSANGTVTITAGTGLNTIYLGLGADTVTLGAHTAADKVVQYNMTSLWSGANDVVTGLQHGDTLQLLLSANAEGWANGSAAAAQIQAGGTLTATIATATSTTNGVNGVFSWFQFGGNTYVLETVGTASSTSNSGYSMVELTGVHDLSGATIVNHALVL